MYASKDELRSWFGRVRSLLSENHVVSEGDARLVSLHRAGFRPVDAARILANTLNSPFAAPHARAVLGEEAVRSPGTNEVDLDGHWITAHGKEVRVGVSVNLIGESFHDSYKKRKWVHVTKADMDKDSSILDDLWGMLELSYKKYGGHKKIRSIGDIERSEYVIYAIDVDADPEADAFEIFRKHSAGLKGVAVGTDGGEVAKNVLMRRSVSRYRDGSVFAEASGAMAHILLKAGVPTVNSQDGVERILGKKVEWVGEHPGGKYKGNPGWYRRVIGGGEKILKILVGRPRGLKSENINEEAAQSLGANEVDLDGHWITVHGRAVYIGASANLREPKKPKNYKVKEVVHTKADGSTYVEKIEPKGWVEQKTKYKFARTASLARQLPGIEKSLEREASGKKLDRKKAAATALLLISQTGMRVGGGRGGTGRSKPKGKGNPKDLQHEDTFGTTTIQRRHVQIKGNTVELSYLGKSGVERRVKVTNKTLARSIRQFMGGKDSAPDDTKPLFSYLGEDGKEHRIDRQKVSERLKKFDKHFKPKDLRTLKANEIASKALLEHAKAVMAIDDQKTRAKMAKRIVSNIATEVAGELGNTPSVAKASYINPALLGVALEMVKVNEAKEDVEKDVLDRMQRELEKPRAEQFRALRAILGDEVVDRWFQAYSDDEDFPDDGRDIFDDPDDAEG